jgi:hypothetical protein
MKRIALLAVCLVLSACSSSSSTTSSAAPAPTQADAERIAIKVPQTTLAKLEMGHDSYIENCQSCHALKNPKNYTEESIRMIVPAMSEKANKKAGKVVVDSEEEVAIMAYMIAIHDRP